MLLSVTCIKNKNEQYRFSFDVFEVHSIYEMNDKSTGISFKNENFQDICVKERFDFVNKAINEIKLKYSIVKSSEFYYKE